MMTDKQYCVRCDELGEASAMEPLYTDPSDAEPAWWLHIKCRTDHGLETGLAQIDAIAAHIQETVKAKATSSMVDLNEHRVASNFAKASTDVVTSIREAMRLQSELEEYGIEPRDFDRFTRAKGRQPETIEELQAFVAEEQAKRTAAAKLEPEGVVRNGDGTVSISVPFTAEAHAQITAAAAKAGVSVGDYMTQTVSKYIEAE
jgi:predicted HicB family RNase H-like nuclease